MNDPSFLIEEDKVGLGYCVIAQWQNGHREVVTGFGDRGQAKRWIEVDASKWLLNIPEKVRGEQWINDRLPKT
ncbi:hypothetical protein ACWX0O_25035 (plasmid) [Nitrobacteraceae bacterium UC4449_H16]